MVYCGKPSKACEPCRIRRVKCDQRRPGCSQCHNTGRVCSGYRAEVEVNFRHQTDAVVQKYGSGSSQSPGSQGSPSQGGPGQGSPGNQGRPPLMPAPAAFLPESTSRAIAVRRYLAQTTEAIHGDYVLPLYERSQCAPVLTTALEAVSLACLANEQARPDLLTPARERYGLALQHVRRGLHSSLHVKGHNNQLSAILSAVMLLAQFAAVAAPAQESPREWSRHVNGAFSLLATRVLQRSCALTVPGRHLFLHLVSCLMVDCLQRRTVFSPQMRALMQARRAEMSEFQLRFWGLVDRMCMLYALQPRASSRGLSPAWIEAAWLTLDHEAAVLMRNMPLSQAYTPEPAAEGPPTTTGPEPPCHVYGSYRIAQQWNTLRMARLVINERLIEHAQSLSGATTEDGQPSTDEPSSSSATIHRAREVLATVIREICACVPASMRTSGSPPPADQLGWAYSLVWPLSMVGVSPHCPAELQPFIARQMAILQAMIGLPIMPAQAPHEWSVVFVLHSLLAFCRVIMTNSAY
ncbi:hypothetical protein BO71DRAFT_436006 [Aspergillus ellipticus CBS 707.79]|uniref:Zn(2)-C6 fungal-type domain-containing protein n=1 Tax=Aspergillus ellipticus CBS 707.79 TaxID=1448320 RepID=A0A319D0T0_9EURO|nr:hypothetical protein BO71DRAFT_436006 [Aspergillus ellipticus CBS 707.79]